jgi:hypothetical protein
VCTEKPAIAQPLERIVEMNPDYANDHVPEIVGHALVAIDSLHH